MEISKLSASCESAQNGRPAHHDRALRAKTPSWLPWCRVYGPERLPRLLAPLRLEKERYWLKTNKNRWTELIVDPLSALSPATIPPILTAALTRSADLFYANRTSPQMQGIEPDAHPLLHSQTFPRSHQLIQRNALQSWKLLHPDVEIIVFGDDEGAAESLPRIWRAPRTGSPPLSARHEASSTPSSAAPSKSQNIKPSVTQTATSSSRRDFLEAHRTLASWNPNHLMVGRRWDTDITEPLHLKVPIGGNKSFSLAKRQGVQRFYHNIDYFSFSPRSLQGNSSARHRAHLVGSLACRQSSRARRLCRGCF